MTLFGVNINLITSILVGGVWYSVVPGTLSMTPTGAGTVRFQIKSLSQWLVTQLPSVTAVIYPVPLPPGPGPNAALSAEEGE